MKRHIVLAGLALALVSTSALAQQRYVAFGDSLSDNGNLFIGSGGTQPPSPPYVGGRFSNGPVWIEQLAGPMAGFFPLGPVNNLVSTNFAFGGARTDVLVANPPGSAAQVGAYFARGGGFAPTDIATMWAGANDIFQGLPVAAATPATAQATMQGIATAAATNVTTQVGQLAAAGARTIVVLNLPNFSTLPQFAGGPAATLAGFSTLTFNGALAQGLSVAAAGAPGANIISVDVAGVFGALQAAPGSFGFTNATQACVPAGLATGCAGYAFFDGVHPTTQGHAVIAAVVRQYLAAPRIAGVFSALGESAVDNRRLGALRAFDRLDAARNLRPGVNSYFISVFGNLQDGKAGANRPSTRWTDAGVTFGLDRAFTTNLAMSAAASVSLGSLRSGGVLTAESFTAAADLAAIYASGPFFAKAGGGLGVTGFSDMERGTVAPLVNRATATATSYHLGLEAGLTHAFGTVEFSPRARLTWLGAHVGAFSEDGFVAPLSLRGQSVGALAAAGELRAAVNLVNEPGRRVAVTALIGYERYLSYTGNALSARLANNTALPFRNVTADPKGPGVIFGLGLSAALGPVWTVSAEYRGSVGERSAVRHGGQLGVRASF